MGTPIHTQEAPQSWTPRHSQTLVSFRCASSTPEPWGPVSSSIRDLGRERRVDGNRSAWRGRGPGSGRRVLCPPGHCSLGSHAVAQSPAPPRAPRGTARSHGVTGHNTGTCLPRPHAAPGLTLCPLLPSPSPPSGQACVRGFTGAGKEGPRAPQMQRG